MTLAFRNRALILRYLGVALLLALMGASANAEEDYEAHLRKIQTGQGLDDESLLEELFEAFSRTHDPRILGAFQSVRDADPKAFRVLFPKLESLLDKELPRTELCRVYDLLFGCETLSDSLLDAIEKRFKPSPQEFPHDVSMREAALLIKHLPASKSDRAWSWLKDQLTHSEKTCRMTAAFLLGRIGKRAIEQSTPLLDSLFDDPSPAVRVIAVSSLQKLGHTRKEFTAVVLKALDEPSEAVVLKPQTLSEQGVTHHELAVKQLGLLQAKEPPAIERLLQATSDADESVRYFAIEALEKIGLQNEKIIGALEQLSEHDSSHAVRYAADRAIRTLSMP